MIFHIPGKARSNLVPRIIVKTFLMHVLRKKIGPHVRPPYVRSMSASRTLIEQFQQTTLKHNFREANHRADALAKKVNFVKPIVVQMHWQRKVACRHDLLYPRHDLK